MSQQVTAPAAPVDVNAPFVARDVVENQQLPASSSKAEHDDPKQKEGAYNEQRLSLSSSTTAGSAGSDDLACPCQSVQGQSWR